MSLPAELMPDDIGITLSIKYGDDGMAHVTAILDPIPAMLVRTAVSAAEVKLAGGDLRIMDGAVQVRGQLSRDGGRVVATFVVPDGITP